VWPAYAAAVLAFASAVVSLYWTLGGTLLLDTLGGTFEGLARERSGTAIALGILVVLVKVVGGLLALGLVRPWGASIWRRFDEVRITGNEAAHEMGPVSKADAEAALYFLDSFLEDV
jgi:hypothetical protein